MVKIFYRKVIASTLFMLFSIANVQAQEKPLYFSELYKEHMQFTDKAKAFNGHEVSFYGYMAPPIKVESDFFVLTKTPLSVCPFCESEADWPDDLIFVTSQNKQPFRITAYNRRIIVSGTLDLGTNKHEDTGFVSRVRLLDAHYNTY